MVQYPQNRLFATFVNLNIAKIRNMAGMQSVQLVKLDINKTRENKNSVNLPTLASKSSANIVTIKSAKKFKSKMMP